MSVLPSESEDMKHIVVILFLVRAGIREWHIQDNVLKHLDDGWDMMIAFPPCTHLSSSSARWFKEKQKDGRQKEAIDFFMLFVNSSIPKIAIENPVGIMSSLYRKPDQYIHPYYFGDTIPKKTCLWLKSLPLLTWSEQNTLFENKTKNEPEYIEYNSKKTKSGKSKYSIFGTMPSTNNPENARKRSVLSSFIAKAMAEQWG